MSGAVGSPIGDSLEFSPLGSPLGSPLEDEDDDGVPGIPDPPDPPGEFIPYELTTWGEPIDPDFDAVELTAMSIPVVGQPSEPIDGLAAIGDRFVSAYLSALNSVNLLTYPVRADLTDPQRTFSIAPWLKGFYGGPHVHILDATRHACVAQVVEAALPFVYGSAQATDFDGSSSELHELAVPFDLQDPLTAFTVFFNGRIDALGAEETLFSLYNPDDPTDFICVRKAGNNVLQAAAFLGGVLVGAGTSLIFDFDAGGIGTDGWCALELVIGAGGALTITFRVFWNGTDAASDGAYQISDAALTTNAVTTFTHLRVGARPGDTVFLNGRCNRLVAVGALPTADQWDDIADDTVDPLTEFIRARHAADLCGRTPWESRNRVNGELPEDTTGTPTLIASEVDSPVDAQWTGPVIKFTVTTSSVSYYMPEADGLWELMVEPGQDAVDIGLRWGADPTATLAAPSQVVNGPRAVFGGGGAKLAMIASAEVDVWIFPLLGNRGP